MFRTLVLSDYDSRLKWGLSLVRRLGALQSTDVVLLPHQASKVERYTSGVRQLFFHDRPLAFLQQADLEAYDIVVVALGGGANVKAALTVSARVIPGRKRPLLVGGFNGLTDRNDPDAILCRVGLDLVTVNCSEDHYAFSKVLTSLQADAPTMLVTGYMREHPVTEEEKCGQRDILFVQQDGIPKSAKAYRYLIEKLLQFLVDNPGARIRYKLRDENRVGINKKNAVYDAKNLAEELVSKSNASHRFDFDFRDIEEILQDVNEVWTVSSTVALEALNLGKSVACISDFGISKYLGNAPLIGSDLFVSLDDLRSGVIVQVSTVWSDRNAPRPISGFQLTEHVSRELSVLEERGYVMRKPFYKPSPWLSAESNNRGMLAALSQYARRFVARRD